MINLDKLFGNLFDSGTQASELHLKNFVQDLMIRIAHYNTGGQYDSMLNAIEAVYTLFFGEITNKDVKLALQQSRTRSVDIVMENFKKDIKIIYKTVTLKYALTDPPYQEVFPYGATEYHEINKTTADTLFTRLETFAGNHAGEFDAAFITKLKGYITSFNAARGIQLAAKEDVTGAVLTKSNARIKLEKAVSVCLHQVAIEFIDDPKQGRAFFNQRLLFPSHHNPQGGTEEDYVLPIPVNVKAKADFEMKNEPDYYLLMSNTGQVNITGYTTDDPTGLTFDSSTKFTMVPGNELIKSYAQMGSHKFLFFYTESTDTAGEVTIEQVDAPIV
jgi:hypothetical protein